MVHLQDAFLYIYIVSSMLKSTIPFLKSLGLDLFQITAFSKYKKLIWYIRYDTLIGSQLALHDQHINISALKFMNSHASEINKDYLQPCICSDQVLTPDDFRLDQLCCQRSYYVHVYVCVHMHVFFFQSSLDFRVADKEHEPAPTFCKLENNFKR